MFNLVVRGGMVVTPAGLMAADIGMEDGRIAAVAPELGGGVREIAATGCVVLPGLIDVHLHFNEPGRTDWEGAESGSRALAAGGGTLFFDMPLNSTPCTVNAREFDRKALALAAASITDFGLWGGIIPGNRDDLADMAARGAVGFKAFLCNSGLEEFPRADDLTLYEGMREAARLGLPVAVHAESEEITAGLTARLIQAGRCDVEAFLESRPVIAETEAIARAGLIAREAGCRLHIVHVSSGRGVAAALEARALGTDVSIETCPHYLLFTEDDLRRVGALAKCAPPLRSERERASLCAAVCQGDIDVVASDHSPCPADLKRGDDFFSIWGGIAGVQWTLPVLLSSLKSELEMDRIAALTSGFGARRFGILNKGVLAPGFDADLVVLDAGASQIITKEKLMHRHTISPWVGREMRGVVRATIRRGEVIYAEGRFPAASPGRLIRPSLEKGRGAPSAAHVQKLSA